MLVNLLKNDEFFLVPFALFFLFALFFRDFLRVFILSTLPFVA